MGKKLIDDEDEAPAKKVRAKDTRAREFACPNCEEPPIADIEEFSRHVEGHRPLGVMVSSTRRGGLVTHSVQCPKGCFRWFTPKRWMPVGADPREHNSVEEMKQHAQTCDGRRPVGVIVKLEEVKRMPIGDASFGKCPVCPEAEPFISGSARGGHFRHSHPGWQQDARFTDLIKATKGAKKLKVDEAQPMVAEEEDEPVSRSPTNRRSFIQTMEMRKAEKAAASNLRSLAKVYRQSGDYYALRAKQVSEEAARIEEGA